MTKDEIQAKADELAQSIGVKVTPIVFVDMDDKKKNVVGFLKEIPLITKYRIMDRMALGGFSACAEMLEDCLLPESDKRILTNDVYSLGAVQEISNMVQIATNQFKKK